MERLKDDFVAGTWGPSFLKITATNEPHKKKRRIREHQQNTKTKTNQRRVDQKKR